jgi:hypothetical protein
MQFSDMISRETRGSSFWNIPTQYYLEHGVVILDLDDIPARIRNIEYARELSDKASVELRVGNEGRRLTSELSGIANEAIKALVRINEDRKEHQRERFLQLGLTVLGFLFTLFLYGGFFIALKRTLISIIERLSIEKEATKPQLSVSGLDYTDS